MKNIVFTIGLSLLLIVFVKVFCPEPNENKELIESFWIKKTFAKQEFDIVACGDSRVYRGISTDELTKNIGENYKAINLGYSSAGLNMDYLLFCASKFRNSTGGKKIMLIGLTPHSLSTQAFKNEDFINYRNIGMFSRYRGLYLSEILSILSPYKPIEIVKRTPDNYLQIYHSDGWVASDYIESDSLAALTSYRKTFASNNVKDKLVVEFISTIADLVKKKYTVVIYRPPSTMAMKLLEDSLSGFNEKEIKERLEMVGAHWIKFPQSEYISYDGSHLNIESAQKLSASIGIEVKKIIAKE